VPFQVTPELALTLLEVIQIALKSFEFLPQILDAVTVALTVNEPFEPRVNGPVNELAERRPPVTGLSWAFFHGSDEFLVLVDLGFE
jgi:hypothetical protein